MWGAWQGGEEGGGVSAYRNGTLNVRLFSLAEPVLANAGKFTASIR